LSPISQKSRTEFPLFAFDKCFPLSSRLPLNVSFLFFPLFVVFLLVTKQPFPSQPSSLPPSRSPPSPHYLGPGLELSSFPFLVLMSLERPFLLSSLFSFILRFFFFLSDSFPFGTFFSRPVNPPCPDPGPDGKVPHASDKNLFFPFP